MILTIKLDWNWSSFQLANIALPQNVMRCDIAPSARIVTYGDNAALTGAPRVHGGTWSYATRSNVQTLHVNWIYVGCLKHPQKFINLH